MKTIAIPHNAPESWQLSYHYDQLEVYASREHLGYSYAYQNRQAKTIAAIQSIAQSGATILDLAAAQGNFSLALAERGFVVTWNDLRADLVDYVKRKYELGKIHYAVGNAFDLAFPELFDVVLIAEVIEHMAHPDEFLQKVASLVKPGGYIVMTTPNGSYFRNQLPCFSDCPDPSQFESQQFQPDGDGHIFLLHRDEVQTLAQQANLRLLQQVFFTNPLTNGQIKLEWLLRLLPQSFVMVIEQLTAKLPLPWASRCNIHTLAVFQRDLNQLYDGAL